VIRSAATDDFEAIAHLYAQLNLDDPPVTGPAFVRVFEEILGREGLDLLLLELDGEVLGSTYLNLIPNLSRGGRPYAVIENVVIAEHRRAEGLGRRLMDATLERAWARGLLQGHVADWITKSEHPRLLPSVWLHGRRQDGLPRPTLRPPPRAGDCRLGMASSQP
jgi:GNAT superfamily N-acetyltransferase